MYFSFGKGPSRWLCLGIVWEKGSKGIYVNLLTFTADFSYGRFGDISPTLSIQVKRLSRSEWEGVR